VSYVKQLSDEELVEIGTRRFARPGRTEVLGWKAQQEILALRAALAAAEAEQQEVRAALAPLVSYVDTLGPGADVVVGHGFYHYLTKAAATFKEISPETQMPPPGGTDGGTV
jgi:hypothetical protein